MSITHLAARALTLLIVVMPGSAAHAAPDDGADFHIRTLEPRLRSLVDDGIRRSTTFRALVERLHGSDVIVYVQTAERWPPGVDGRMTFATAAGGYRYVIVQLRDQPSRMHLAALLAHELRHVVEVAEAPAIVDGASLAREYRRIGYSRRLASEGGVAFDTDAAVETGHQVLAELLAGGNAPARRQRRILAALGAPDGAFVPGGNTGP
jgi:hypothetical protein